MEKEELEVVKNAARVDEWYKRGGVFKDAYDILTRQPTRKKRVIIKRKEK